MTDKPEFLGRQDGYICSGCAEKRGWEWPTGHRATAHEGRCPHCAQIGMLTSVTDWRAAQLRCEHGHGNLYEQCPICQGLDDWRERRMGGPMLWWLFAVALLAGIIITVTTAIIAGRNPICAGPFPHAPHIGGLAHGQAPAANSFP